MNTKPKIKKDILVVDPDYDTTVFLQKILETAGYNTLVSQEAESALNSIESNTPHIILIDQSLPALGEILNFLKTSSVYSKIPLVLMTASKSKKLLLKALSNGAQDIVYKPIMPQTLLQKLKKVLKGREFPHVNFENPEKVKATFLGEIIKINELGLILQSSIKFKGETPLSIESAFLKRLGAHHCQTKTTTEAKVANPGVYRNEVMLRGMDEATAQTIRKQKKT
jgi:DNA-binding NtrC family response regulator